MENPNRRTEKVLSRQVETLMAALHEKQIEQDLLESYLEEVPEPDDTDRPSDEAIERDLNAVLEEAEILESKFAAAMKAWSRIVYRKLGIEP